METAFLGLGLISLNHFLYHGDWEKEQLSERALGTVESWPGHPLGLSLNSSKHLDSTRFFVAEEV